MRRKILIRSLIGVVSGFVMMIIIPAVLNRAQPSLQLMYSEDLLQRAGSPTGAIILTLVLVGVYGALCFGCTLFYEIERWPLALATVMHYLVVSLGYLLPACVLGWNMSVKLLLLIEGFMTLGFFAIWLIMLAIYKRQVREINELLRERSEKTQSDQDETNRPEENGR